MTFYRRLATVSEAFLPQTIEGVIAEQVCDGKNLLDSYYRAILSAYQYHSDQFSLDAFAILVLACKTAGQHSDDVGREIVSLLSQLSAYPLTNLDALSKVVSPNGHIQSVIAAYRQNSGVASASEMMVQGHPVLEVLRLKDSLLGTVRWDRLVSSEDVNSILRGVEAAFVLSYFRDGLDGSQDMLKWMGKFVPTVFEHYVSQVLQSDKLSVDVFEAKPAGVSIKPSVVIFGAKLPYDAFLMQQQKVLGTIGEKMAEIGALKHRMKGSSEPNPSVSATLSDKQGELAALEARFISAFDKAYSTATVEHVSIVTVDDVNKQPLALRNRLKAAVGLLYLRSWESSLEGLRHKPTSQGYHNGEAPTTKTAPTLELNYITYKSGLTLVIGPDGLIHADVSHLKGPIPVVAGCFTEKRHSGGRVGSQSLINTLDMNRQILGGKSDTMLTFYRTTQANLALMVSQGLAKPKTESNMIVDQMNRFQVESDAFLVGLEREATSDGPNSKYAQRLLLHLREIGIVTRDPTLVKLLTLSDDDVESAFPLLSSDKIHGFRRQFWSDHSAEFKTRFSEDFDPSRDAHRSKIALFLPELVNPLLFTSRPKLWNEWMECQEQFAAGGMPSVAKLQRAWSPAEAFRSVVSVMLHRVDEFATEILERKAYEDHVTSVLRAVRQVAEAPGGDDLESLDLQIRDAVINPPKEGGGFVAFGQELDGTRLDALSQFVTRYLDEFLQTERASGRVERFSRAAFLERLDLALSNDLIINQKGLDVLIANKQRFEELNTHMAEEAAQGPYYDYRDTKLNELAQKFYESIRVSEAYQDAQLRFLASYLPVKQRFEALAPARALAKMGARFVDVAGADPKLDVNDRALYERVSKEMQEQRRIHVGDEGITPDHVYDRLVLEETHPLLVQSLVELGFSPSLLMDTGRLNEDASQWPETAEVLAYKAELEARFPQKKWDTLWDIVAFKESDLIHVHMKMEKPYSDRSVGKKDVVPTMVRHLGLMRDAHRISMDPTVLIGVEKVEQESGPPLKRYVVTNPMLQFTLNMERSFGSMVLLPTQVDVRTVAAFKQGYDLAGYLLSKRK